LRVREEAVPLMVAKFDPDSAPAAPVVVEGNDASISAGSANGLPDSADTLLSFLPESEIAGRNFNPEEAARPTVATHWTLPQAVPSSANKKGEPPATAATLAAPDTIDAINKLEARLAALTTLQSLCNDIDERLVRAERALQRTEDLVADRTFMHLYSRIGEGLVRTEETCRRMETFIADRTLQQLSARIDARLADTEDAVHRIERLVADGSRRGIAQGRESLARTEEELRNIKRLIQTDSFVTPDGTGHQTPAGREAIGSVLSRYPWIPALGGHVKHLARRAAPALVLFTVTAIVALGHTDVRARPNETPLSRSAAAATPTDPAPAVESSPQPTPVRAAEVVAPPLAIRSEPEEAVVASRPSPARVVDTRESPQPTVYVGTLLVVSQPAGASVFVNGKPVGVTPLKLADQRAGSLALRITRDGFQRWTAAVQVPAGRSTQITATLLPENP